VAQTTPWGGESYAFDSLGRTSQIVESGGAGSTTTYAYDSLGRVWNVNDSGSGLTSYAYDFWGRTTGVSEPGGVTRTATFDYLGRVSQTNTSIGNNSVYSRSFEYDAVGRVTSESASGSNVATYGYDERGQLVSAGKNGVTYGYQYDAAGNRTLAASGGVTRYFAYDAANRLTSVSGAGGTMGVSHDANGNMTQLGGDTLSWNERGQLSGVSGGGITSSFAYDAYGRRVGKSVSGVGTRSYQWSGWSARGGSGAGGAFGRTEGLDDHQRLGGNVAVSDHLGSVVGLLDNSGQLAQQRSFDPFGQQVSSTNGAVSPYGFTGLESDESGLLYARNRYYSPLLGRFISEDPIGFAGGSNFYAYCGNDPVNFTDPLGLYTEDPWGWAKALGGALYGAGEMLYQASRSGVADIMMDMADNGIASLAAYRCGGFIDL
jgi:RHS repeat-associated protein